MNYNISSFIFLIFSYRQKIIKKIYFTHFYYFFILILCKELVAYSRLIKVIDWGKMGH